MEPISVSSTHLSFGKYKNEALKDLCVKDGRYLIWLLKQDWVNEETLNGIKKVIGNVILNFGRHSGSTINFISETDPDYVKWLLGAN